MATMQAVLFKEEGKVAVEEVERPEIQEANDVILKVTKTMICGTDLHFVHGTVPLDPDFILGHEYLGEIVELGDGVIELDEGDVCVGSFMACCGKCWACRRANYAQCVFVRVFGMGSAFGDQPGGQAEYIRVPDAALTLRKVPDDVDQESAAFLGDIFTTGYDAIMRAGFRHGDSVAVVGGGPVGLCTVLAAKAMGAGPVVVVDLVDERLKIAEEHGAIGVNPKTGDPEEVVKDATDWRGADIVVDAVGHPTALASTVTLVRMGGQISIPGVYMDDDAVFPNFNEAYIKGVRITMGIGDIQGQIDSAMGLIRGGANPASLISHRMGMSEAAEGYRLFDSKEAFKVVLDPST